MKNKFIPDNRKTGQEQQQFSLSEHTPRDVGVTSDSRGPQSESPLGMMSAQDVGWTHNNNIIINSYNQFAKGDP